MNGYAPTHRVTLYFEDGTCIVEESNLSELMPKDSPQERKNLLGTWESPFDEGTLAAWLLDDFKTTWALAHLAVEFKGLPGRIVVESL